MSADESYLPNYRTSTLYLNPTSKGVYATMVIDTEVLIGEIDITTRSKLAFSVFYVDEKKNIGTFKVTKLQYHATYGWRKSNEIVFNNFDMANLNLFLKMIKSIDFAEKTKVKLNLDDIDETQISAILSNSQARSIP